MLAIELELLTGRYVATAYNSRDEGEWPPHPARLFSALVATHFAAAGEPSVLADERAVLEWLERQGPPSIVASEAAPRDVATVFVPVNDVALTDVDDEAERADQARAALAGAESSGDTRAAKSAAAAVKKAEAALKKAITAATAVPPRPVHPRYGQRVLPEYRGRQPRTFPSMTPADPRVTYVWQDAAPSAGQRAVLDALLERFIRLGHSSTLISARLTNSPGPPTLRPAPEGDVSLRVVESGQLAALARAFERHREIEPRVMPFMPQPYVRETLEQASPAQASVFSADWLVLRRVGGPLFPMTAAAGLARAVRRTLMSYAGDDLPEVLSGHTPDRQPSHRPHLAIVPLPFIGHEHATGAILGIALVLPRAVSASDRQAVYRAVARWEQQYRQEDEDPPSVQLNLGASGEWYLQRVEWDSAQASLRSHVWCEAARVWYSATPVALDRNPGDLRARDPRKLAAALEEARQTLSDACEWIGVPRPTSVEILPAAPWAGAAEARSYPRYPGDDQRPQRALTHVRLEFDERVRGPILLGAGRYLGLGLFRPEPSR